MSKRRYSKAEVAEALRDTRGLVSIAAARLGCAPKTVYQYLERYPGLREILALERQARGDNLELRAYNEAMNGNTYLLQFLLKTQYKDRGYTERLEIDVRYVAMVKQIEALAGQHGVTAADLLNDLITALAKASESGT